MSKSCTVVNDCISYDSSSFNAGTRDVSSSPQSHGHFHISEFKIIAIQNYGSSGTLFLHSLLDNHPQVIQLPGLVGLNFFSRATNFFKKTKITNIQQYQEFLLNFYAPLFTYEKLAPRQGLLELGENADQSPVVSEASFNMIFQRNFQSGLIELGEPDIFEDSSLPILLKLGMCSAYQTYAELISTNNISKKQYICYPIHSADVEEAYLIQELFDDCSFVHCIRHPLENMDSCTKYYFKQQKYMDITLSPFACGISQMFLDRAPHIHRFTPLYGEISYPAIERTGLNRKEFALSLEKLHENPAFSLQQLCHALEIEWHDSLTKSTFAGKTWWNRPGLQRVSGFSKTITGRKDLNYFNKLDQWRLKNIARPLLCRQGYSAQINNPIYLFEQALAMLACILPFKLEITFKDAFRDVYQATKGRKHLTNLNTVAHTYWDARRKTCGALSPIINHDEELKPEHQRLFMLSVDKEGTVKPKRLFLDNLTTLSFKHHVILDPDDKRIPQLTKFVRLKFRFITFVADYIEHRKLLFRSFKRVRAIKQEVLAPIN